MRLPGHLLVFLCACLFAVYAQNVISSQNTILDNGILLKQRTGSGLTKAMGHKSFTDVITRMQNRNARTTVVAPLKDSWGYTDVNYDESMTQYYLEMLRHHVVDRTVIPQAIRAEEPDWQVEHSLLNDLSLRFRKTSDGGMQIMSASGNIVDVVETVPCINGIIYLTTGALWPPGFSQRGNTLIVEGVNDNEEYVDTTASVSNFGGVGFPGAGLPNGLPNGLPSGFPNAGFPSANNFSPRPFRLGRIAQTFANIRAATAANNPQHNPDFHPNANNHGHNNGNGVGIDNEWSLRAEEGVNTAIRPSISPFSVDSGNENSQVTDSFPNDNISTENFSGERVEGDWRANNIDNGDSNVDNFDVNIDNIGMGWPNGPNDRGFEWNNGPQGPPPRGPFGNGMGPGMAWGEYPNGDNFDNNNDYPVDNVENNMNFDNRMNSGNVDFPENSAGPFMSEGPFGPSRPNGPGMNADMGMGPFGRGNGPQFGGPGPREWMDDRNNWNGDVSDSANTNGNTLGNGVGSGDVNGVGNTVDTFSHASRFNTLQFGPGGAAAGGVANTPATAGPGVGPSSGISGPNSGISGPSGVSGPVRNTVRSAGPPSSFPPTTVANPGSTAGSVVIYGGIGQIVDPTLFNSATQPSSTFNAPLAAFRTYSIEAYPSASHFTLGTTYTPHPPTSNPSSASNTNLHASTPPLLHATSAAHANPTITLASDMYNNQHNSEELINEYNFSTHSTGAGQSVGAGFSPANVVDSPTRGLVWMSRAQRISDMLNLREDGTPIHSENNNSRESSGRNIPVRTQSFRNTRESMHENWENSAVTAQTQHISQEHPHQQQQQQQTTQPSPATPSSPITTLQNTQHQHTFSSHTQGSTPRQLTARTHGATAMTADRRGVKKTTMALGMSAGVVRGGGAGSRRFKALSVNGGVYGNENKHRRMMSGRVTPLSHASRRGTSMAIATASGTGASLGRGASASTGSGAGGRTANVEVRATDDQEEHEYEESDIRTIALNKPLPPAAAANAGTGSRDFYSGIIGAGPGTTTGVNTGAAIIGTGTGTSTGASAIVRRPSPIDTHVFPRGRSRVGLRVITTHSTSPIHNSLNARAAPNTGNVGVSAAPTGGSTGSGLVDAQGPLLSGNMATQPSSMPTPSTTASPSSVSISTLPAPTSSAIPSTSVSSSSPSISTTPQPQPSMSQPAQTTPQVQLQPQANPPQPSQAAVATRDEAQPLLDVTAAPLPRMAQPLPVAADVSASTPMAVAQPSSNGGAAPVLVAASQPYNGGVPPTQARDASVTEAAPTTHAPPLASPPTNALPSSSLPHATSASPSPSLYPPLSNTPPAAGAQPAMSAGVSGDIIVDVGSASGERSSTGTEAGMGSGVAPSNTASVLHRLAALTHSSPSLSSTTSASPLTSPSRPALPPTSPSPSSSPPHPSPTHADGREVTAAQALTSGGEMMSTQVFPSFTVPITDDGETIKPVLPSLHEIIAEIEREKRKRLAAIGTPDSVSGNADSQGNSQSGATTGASGINATSNSNNSSNSNTGANGDTTSAVTASSNSNSNPSGNGSPNASGSTSGNGSGSSAAMASVLSGTIGPFDANTYLDVARLAVHIGYKPTTPGFDNMP